MGWNHTLDKGSDLPTWEWLSMPPVLGYNGTNGVYDGFRYIYWGIQYGSTSTTASSIEFYKYDTWSDGWIYIANITNTNNGCRMVYDWYRNLVWIAVGNGTTSLQVFNPNHYSVNVMGQSFQQTTLSNVTLTLPIAANAGCSLFIPKDEPLDKIIMTGTVATITDGSYYFSSINKKINYNMVGLQVRFTSGVKSGTKGVISSITNVNSTSSPVYPNFSDEVVTNQIDLDNNHFFTQKPAIGDSFVIEYPEFTVTSSTSNTVTVSGVAARPPSQTYRYMDILLPNGNRHSITDYNALYNAVFTISGTFTSNPVAGSKFRVVPSSRYMYYNSTTTNSLYQIDLSTGLTTPSWTTLFDLTETVDSRSRLMADPMALQGAVMLNSGGAIRLYNIGRQTKISFTPQSTAEWFTAGGTMTELLGDLNILVHTRAGATRILGYSLNNGYWPAITAAPYATHTAYDGQRLVYVKTTSGQRWLYYLRPGGVEFYRLDLDFLS